MSSEVSCCAGLAKQKKLPDARWVVLVIIFLLVESQPYQEIAPLLSIAASTLVLLACASPRHATH
jgi:hypothetical protein